MVRHFIAIALVLGATPSFALTLDEAVDQAVSSHPRMATARAQRQASDERIRQTQARYLPTVELNAFLGREAVERPGSASVGEDTAYETPRSIALEVEQVLFDGFSRTNELEQRVAETNAAAGRVTAEAEALALETVSAYFDVLRQRRILDISEESIAIHNRYVGLVGRAFDGGGATRGEVEQAKERLAAAESFQRDIQLSLGVAEARLVNLLGAPAGALSDSGGPSDMPASLDQALDIALRENSQLRVFNEEVRAAQFAAEERRSPYFPQVSLEGSAQRAEDIAGIDGEDNRYGVRLNFSWNLYNGGGDTAREREALQELAAASRQRDTALRDVRETVERAWSDLAALDQLIESRRHQASHSARVVEAYRDEYDTGVRDFLDILNAEASLLNTRVEIETASAIRRVAAYTLIAASGQILQEFGVSQDATALPLGEVSAFPY